MDRQRDSGAARLRTGLPAPGVSVVIPAGPGEDLSRVIHALRAQSLTDWQAVIAGGPCTAETQRLTARDERFVFAMTGETDTWPGRVNAGVERAGGVYVTILEPRDYLAPEALEALVSSARASGAGGMGAFGGFAFAGPLGVLPVDPLTGVVRGGMPGQVPSPGQRGVSGGSGSGGAGGGWLGSGGGGGWGGAIGAGETIPRVLTAHELAACKLIPLHAQIVRREVAAGVRFEAGPEEAGDHRWLLALASRGVTWAWTGTRLAVAAMERPVGAGEITRRLGAHARVIAAATATGLPVGSREHAAAWRSALADHVEAALHLEAFERAADPVRRGAGEPGCDTSLATHTEFGNLFAQWWQRLRFLGRPPRHVLAATVPATVVPGAGVAGGMLTPEAIAARLVDSAEPGRAVILLGLGRNARQVARVIHSRGRRVVGRDEGLREPPAWAAQDGVPVVLLPSEEPWDTSAHYLMTIAEDAAYLARVPRGVRVSRWRDMPELIREAWIEAALPRLLQGQPLLPAAGPRSTPARGESVPQLAEALTVTGGGA